MADRSRFGGLQPSKPQHVRLFPQSQMIDPFVDKQYRMMKNVEENSRKLKRLNDIIDVLQNILEKLLYTITETGPLDCSLIKNSLRRQQKRVKHHPSL